MSDLKTYPMNLGGGAPDTGPGPDVQLPARPVVDRSLLRHPVPEYTPEQVQELLALLYPLRLYTGGRWVTLELTLDRLRQSDQLYMDDLQDKLDAEWRPTGAYRMAVDQAMAEQREAADDRRYDRERENRREQAADRRMTELMEHGLSPRDAQAQVAREFPEEG